MRRQHLPKVIEMYPEIYYGKYYDYRAKKVDNHFEIYRRELEGKPWKLYARAVIVDGEMFTHWVGLMDKEEGD